jgi:uncharacterized Tic20 family protein
MSQTPPPANPYESAAQLSPSDEKLWATLVHVLGIFFSVVPALLGYLLLRDRGPFVREHTAAALNFQITMLIAAAIGWVTILILIGFFVVTAVAVLVVVFSIIAAVAANRGQTYKYPLSIEFVK